MRSLPAALTAHLDSGTTTLCRCWKLMPRSGAALGFTDHDRDLFFDGVTFEAQSGFTASEIEQSPGFAVNNLETGGALQSDRLSEARIAAGDFDHAAMEIWRVNWQDVAQRHVLRAGHIGEISRSATGFSAEVRGLTAMLDQPRGRVFMAACDAAVGDGRCGVNLQQAAYRGEGTVAAVDGSRLTVQGLAGFASEWFSRGSLLWITGANAGRKADIKSHAKNGSGVLLELWQAGPPGPAMGDQFTVTAGCSKSFDVCRNKFSNGPNFRGFPHMPGDDFVVSYPVHDDPANTGGSLNP